jgi:hypothetical protein
LSTEDKPTEVVENTLTVPAETEQAKPEQAPPEDTGEAPKPKPGRFQQRISELVQARRKADDETRFWRDKALAAEQAAQPKAPKAEDYNGDVDRFENDRTQYLTEMSARQANISQIRAPELVAQREVERHDAEYQSVLEENWQSRVAEAQKDPNWAAVALSQSVPVDAVMGEFIKSIDRGPDVLFQLGKNPELAARISELPERAKIAELVRLELSLAAPKAKPVSNAPRPPDTVDGGSEGAGEDPEKMNADQWRTWRNKQVRRR